MTPDRIENPPTPPEDFDLLMQDVLSELANQPTPAGLASRLNNHLHRSSPMNLASAGVQPSNLLEFCAPHFHTLDRTGGRGFSPKSISIAIALNLAAVLLIGIQIHGSNVIRTNQMQTLSYLPPMPPPEPLKAVPPIVPPVVTLRLTPPVEPIITLPHVSLEARLEQPVMPAPVPAPMLAPAPARTVVAAAAPRPAPVNLGQSASVINQDSHPSAVALGRADNPIAPSSRVSASAVNLGQRGLNGMPAGNVGGGQPSTSVKLGSGLPQGTYSGGGGRTVAGVKLGVAEGNGQGKGAGAGGSIGPAQVSLAQKLAAVPTASASASPVPASHAPQVVYKPRPEYTAEATGLHIEGTIWVRIRVSATGVVTIVGVTKGLGHGLDEAALKAARGIRFKPALDADGNPTAWEGVVTILFQLS